MDDENGAAQTGSEYAHGRTAYDEELERLRIGEEICDPWTIRRLERVGVAEGWSCLEVAAGAGSIAAWLGRRVGVGGRVLAVDMDTRFLGGLSEPVEVRELNLLTDDLELGVFDLVHARLILMHLRDRDLVLKKMAAAVRPGGWLVIEERDLGPVAGLGDHPSADLFTGAWRSLSRRIKELSPADVLFGRRVRELIDGLGFEEVVADGDTRIWRGGEAGARYFEMSARAFHARGMFSDEEYDLIERLARDPSFTFAESVMYGAWGRRPN